ncbi:HET-domain-containing protein [Hypoxylon trugodes]|uniref:HET-domain-containing protein n=1 Tax=Hypoxylon trugodes TaxID=326681 RepID=UPI00219222CC|nr:HET-domain-containing protein [Hypoxylon trugodes]KAI1391719.1 HET-domain-containing protein [Hypoxylon trugodes]
MRLIDVNTLELKEFFGESTPSYAILSHTWDGNKEVTFQEWERRTTDKAIQRKEGYAKIIGACRRARADGLQYLWCDTNCIDKRSEAELSEAINSMFAWYRDSHVCYAYLADVEAKTGTFAKSRWFTRGWTLQELLAPKTVMFYDYRWTVLGDRAGLAEMISGNTRIHLGVLNNRSTIYDYSIAQQMSWAADRRTTRSEDIAYCLLGIFDINMPLLYGEGQKAFTRLQREIIEVSNDQSILAWDLPCSDPHPWTSAFAPSPAEFRFCGSIVKDHKYDHNPYSVTNLGLSMNLALVQTLVRRLVLVGLNCTKQLYREAPHPKPPGKIKLHRPFRIWIPLYLLNHHTYARAHYPSSKVFFGRSYITLERPIPTGLFLTMDSTQARNAQPLQPSTQIMRDRSSDSPSGLHIAIAAGNTAPNRHALTEVYPLGDIFIVQLKRRGPGTASHQLISCGNLSIIISVLWDKNESPRTWLHTIILNPQLKVTCQMASSVEWNCFFEEHGHSQQSQCCNNVANLHSLHEKLERAHGASLNPCYKYKDSLALLFESHPLKDLFGRQELVVDIILKGKPEST